MGIKKYYNPLDSYLEGGRIVNKPEPAIRYAEVLLIYAEALNELTGTFAIASWDEESTISVSRNTDEISQYISQIRLRAGIPDYDASVYNDAAIFRTNIKRERQIELFAEGHRYFDLRRWKDAPKEEAEVVRGFNMNMERNQRDLFEIPVKIPSLPTVFVNRMYLWPLSPTELKRNNKLTQNPGWETFD
ncbi:MAG: RagB/SusD family nutrient uptake outer membrane protein [Bacteroidales bacterium]|nr:RagB/SusD family nutrient uptake outer membrane protein [Bacteroidales bacterium]